MAAEDRERSDEADVGVPASFALVWDAIADVIGTAATAALVRRAAKRTSGAYPMLAQLAIERRSFTPEYTLPLGWISEPTGSASTHEFQALLDELTTLLEQLTGAVVVRRLAHLALPVGRVEHWRGGAM